MEAPTASAIPAAIGQTVAMAMRDAVADAEGEISPADFVSQRDM